MPPTKLEKFLGIVALAFLIVAIALLVWALCDLAVMVA